MDLTPWPPEFFERKAGRGCPHCIEGRPSETDHGVRFFEGSSTDGYLQRVAPTPGYAVVIFRERHVPNLHSMTGEEAARFWTEVAVVADAIERTYEPAHLNVQVLGNAVPHVHAHVVCRHNPDPSPSSPLPADAWASAIALHRGEIEAQVQRLRAEIRRAR